MWNAISLVYLDYKEGFFLLIVRHAINRLIERENIFSLLWEKDIQIQFSSEIECFHIYIYIYINGGTIGGSEAHWPWAAIYRGNRWKKIIIFCFLISFFFSRSFLFVCKITSTRHAPLPVTSTFNKLGQLSETPVLESGPTVSDLLVRLPDHTWTFQKTSPLSCIFCTTNIYFTLPCFCNAMIDLNNF